MEVHTVTEAAEILRVSPERVREMLRSGELAGYRTAGNAGRWRISSDAINRYINNKEQG